MTVSGADGVPVLPTPPVPPTVELVPPGSGRPAGHGPGQCIRAHRPGHELPGVWYCPDRRHRRVLGKSEDGQWWVVRLDPQ